MNFIKKVKPVMKIEYLKITHIVGKSDLLNQRGSLTNSQKTNQTLIMLALGTFNSKPACLLKNSD